MCKKFTITGRVQGVGFRWSTKRQAQNLNLTGYAENKQDGSVEVLVCGSQQSIATFEEWLNEGGPRTAGVKSIYTKKTDVEQKPTTFDTR